MKLTALKSTRMMLVAIVLLLQSLISFAQSSGSGISGFIYDEGNEPFEAATISVRNSATGFTATTSSDRKGYFALRDLPVGPYDIEVSAIGAQKTVLKNNLLNLGDRLV